MPCVRISSASNPRYRSSLRLRNGRFRRRSGLFLVDGRREFSRALAAGIPLDALFLTDNVSPDAFFRSLLVPQESLAAARSAPVFQLTSGLFTQLAYGGRDEGVVAVFRTPERPLGRFCPRADPLLVVLDRLEKPGNIGAVFRSADAAGADGILMSDCGTDLFNPNAIRASAGTVFSMPTAVARGAEIRDWLTERQIRVVATRVDAPETHWHCDWRGGVAIVLGNEAAGLGPEWSGEDVLRVRIPMTGVADSLNASITAAICLFEAARQRIV